MPHGEIVDALTNCKACDFLLVDEAHKMVAKNQEAMYSVIDERRIPRLVGEESDGGGKYQAVQPITLMVATDQPGKLLNALHKRMEIHIRLGYYTDREMRDIVDRITSDLGILLSPQAATLNDYALPAGWLPVAAINPPDDDYLVGELDPALASRFAQVEVQCDHKEWLLWARGSDVHPSVIRYVESDDTVFDDPESNPRSWVYVSKVLYTSELYHSTLQTVRAAVIGLVGDVRGAAFMSSLKKSERPLAADDIISSYAKHRRKVRDWLTHGRVDLVDASLRSLLVFLQPKAEFVSVKRSAKQMANVAAFFKDLPGDQRQEAQRFFDDRKYILPSQQKQKAK